VSLTCGVGVMAELVAAFGMEAVILYTAVLLKKRIAVYGARVPTVLRVVRYGVCMRVCVCMYVCVCMCVCMGVCVCVCDTRCLYVDRQWVTHPLCTWACACVCA
jgi:hypothetical protein